MLLQIGCESKMALCPSGCKRTLIPPLQQLFTQSKPRNLHLTETHKTWLTKQFRE